MHTSLGWPYLVLACWLCHQFVCLSSYWFLIHRVFHGLKLKVEVPADADSQLSRARSLLSHPAIRSPPATAATSSSQSAVRSLTQQTTSSSQSAVRSLTQQATSSSQSAVRSPTQQTTRSTSSCDCIQNVIKWVFGNENNIIPHQVWGTSVDWVWDIESVML